MCTKTRKYKLAIICSADTVRRPIVEWLRFDTGMEEATQPEREVHSSKYVTNVHTPEESQ